MLRAAIFPVVTLIPANSCFIIIQVASRANYNKSCLSCKAKPGFLIKILASLTLGHLQCLSQVQGAFVDGPPGDESGQSVGLELFEIVHVVDGGDPARGDYRY